MAKGKQILGLPKGKHLFGTAKVGDKVKAGQLIGYVGTTGDSTGNHLHFEVRRDGVYYDPAEFVSQ